MVTPAISIVPATTIIVEDLSSISDSAVSARKPSQTVITAISPIIARSYTTAISIRTRTADVSTIAPSIPRITNIIVGIPSHIHCPISCGQNAQAQTRIIPKPSIWHHAG